MYFLQLNVFLLFIISNFIVMTQTPFHLTSNKIEHHFSNTKQTRTCSSNVDQTRTPYFEWPKDIEPNGALTGFTKLIIKLTQTSFFWTLNEFKHVDLLIIELKLFLASNDLISNLEHCSTHHYNSLIQISTTLDDWRSFYLEI